MIDLDQLVVEANSLAPLPASTVRLAQMMSSSDWEADDVCELVAFDPALSANLLRGANSAANSGATPVVTVQEAVLRLGAAQVLALAVAGNTRAIMKKRVDGYGLEEGKLWRHSVAAAVAAEVLPQFSSEEIPAESFPAALLHDIGKLIMGRYLVSEVRHFLHLVETSGVISEADAEMEVCHAHHGELGGIIAQHWQLPPRIVLGIIYHHNPEQGNDIVCDVTYVANLVAKDIEARLDGRRLETSITPESLYRVGLVPEKWERFCRTAAARFADVSRRYNSV
jgi:HD-like signal output (HDOD) protein